SVFKLSPAALHLNLIQSYLINRLFFSFWVISQTRQFVIFELHQPRARKMQINKVMSLLDILTSWLEDNINMESDLFFDNDVDNTTSESLYPAVEKTNAVLSKLASLSSETIQATRQRLQDAVEGKGEVSTADVKELLLATRYLMLTTDGE